MGQHLSDVFNADCYSCQTLTWMDKESMIMNHAKATLECLIVSSVLSFWYPSPRSDAMQICARVLPDTRCSPPLDTRSVCVKAVTIITFLYNFVSHKDLDK